MINCKVQHCMDEVGISLLNCCRVGFKSFLGQTASAIAIFPGKTTHLPAGGRSWGTETSGSVTWQGVEVPNTKSKVVVDLYMEGLL